MSKIVKSGCGYDNRVISPFDPTIWPCDMVRDCVDCPYFKFQSHE